MPEELGTASDALSRELARKRIQSVRRVNLLRLCGVSAFFALFLLTKPLSLEPLAEASAPLLLPDARSAGS